MFDISIPIMCDSASGRFTTVIWHDDDCESSPISLVEGFGISEFSGSDRDWNAYVLRNEWDLDSALLKGDLRHDELMLRFRLGKDWFGTAKWGYRRCDNEKWNSSRSQLSFVHRGTVATSEFAASYVSSSQEEELKRYQGTFSSEFLQGFFRPFGNADFRYTVIDSSGKKTERGYAKTAFGATLNDDLWNVKEVVGVLDVRKHEMKRGEDVEDLSKIDAIMGIEREETGDFIVNEKDKLVNLTAEGVAKVERFFRIENLADPENLEIQHCIILALRAHNLMHRDHDYIVKDDQVLIVDEFTGRVMPGRRYSDGLHQAIEAKEHVKVKRESRTLATITFQNFFNKFDKKCGMTGTALTEEREFREIYGMDVIEIPTNRPVIRFDDQDAVYKTKKEKFRAVVNAVKEAYEKGQPVLVGTITIQVSEEVSKMLKKAGIPHNVLNAKFHEMEAEIVAEAGRHGAVTIATNMAGRGTDIKLDEEARAAGGLKIIGTERHESRRIDNQLRGRSGRQGDPGESRFYISLEDDLMRLFGSDRMTAMFNALNIPEDQEITHKSLSKAIEGAQKKIENNNFGIRKNLLDYDQVMNEQREIIYAQRREVLDGKSMRDSVFNMITDFVDSTVDTCISDDIDSDDWNLTELNELLLPTIPLEVVTRGRIRERTRDGLKQQLKEEAVALYESKEAEFPEAEAVRELERVVILKVVDRKWMDHIDDMEQLRQSIGLQAYGQHDPLVEYKMAGYDMFNEMTRNIMEETVRVLFHVKVEQKVEREEVAKATGTNKDDTAVKQPKRRTDKKIYPNDPCPCCSGKKYKNCHGRPGMSL